LPTKLTVLAGVIWLWLGAGMAHAADCASLKGAAVPASAIALKTKGAQVASAAMATEPAKGAVFCRIHGLIHPIDPKAPDIEFILDLPEQWNGKAVQIGGGGWDGQLPEALGNRGVNHFLGNSLANGYASFGGDSGHKLAPGVDAAAFALNDEALANFAGDHLKKTHDAALALIRMRYGASPKRTYFMGGSQGGREALQAIQHWPKDYDGAGAFYPANAWMGMDLTRLAHAKRLYRAPGAWPSPDKVALVTAAVLRACDGLDGLADGVIANVKACRAQFHIDALRCPAGTVDGPACLTDGQVAALKALDTETRFGFALDNGIDRFPGGSLFDGGDTRIYTLGANLNPKIGPSADYGYADQWVRYVVARDPAIDPLTVDPAAFVPRLQRLSKMIDATRVDLSPFEKRGSKLLLFHGTADMLISPYNSIGYFEKLKAMFGPQRLARFTRFYLAPGQGHGADGVFQVEWDALSVLDAWADRGQPPGSQVAVDTAAPTAGRSLPLCEYPTWPKYAGGDPKSASSFVCASS
jgi:hypothetical protein